MVDTSLDFLKVAGVAVLFLISLLLGLSPLLVPLVAGRCRDQSAVLRRLSKAVACPSLSARLQLSQTLRCLTAGVMLATCLMDLLPESTRRIHSARRQLGLTSSFPLVEFFISVGFFVVLLTEQGMLAWLETSAGRQDEEDRLHHARVFYSLPTLTNLSLDSGVISLRTESVTKSDSASPSDGGVCDVFRTDGDVTGAVVQRSAFENPQETLKQGRNSTLFFQKNFRRTTDDIDIEMTAMPPETGDRYCEDETHRSDLVEHSDSWARKKLTLSPAIDVSRDTAMQNPNDSRSCGSEEGSAETLAVKRTTCTSDYGSFESSTSMPKNWNNKDNNDPRHHSTGSRSTTPRNTRTSPVSVLDARYNDEIETEESTSRLDRDEENVSPHRPDEWRVQRHLPQHANEAVSAVYLDGGCPGDATAVGSPEAVTSTVQSDLSPPSLSSTSCDNRGDNPYNHSMLRSMLLVVALSLHVFFEGLTLTLAATRQEVFRFSVVVILHRCMVSASLGEQLRFSQLSLLVSVVSMIVFALASPLGLAVGLGLGGVTSGAGELVQGGVLALACGTFLYLVLFGILPSELLGQEEERFLKLLCIVLGYSGMVLVLLLSSTLNMCLE